MKEQSTVVPRHLGLILDGNRRWAKTEGLSVAEGHRAGYQNLKRISEAAFSDGVEYVSAYVFSTENWSRSKDEVKDLMKLLFWVVRHEVENLSKHGIRIRMLGSKMRLGKALLKAIHKAEEATKNNQRGTLLLCLDYGGHQEIVDAMKRIVTSGIPESDITVELINQHLYEPDVPPVDLIIRTSGEKRLSGFMLPRAAYSELYFTDKNWPAFTEQDLTEALADYAHRHRRFGK